MSAPTLEQLRAKHAWEAVQCAKRKKPEAAKEFGRHAKKLPPRILTAGLGQALGFLHAKKEAPDLLLSISDWVLYKRVDAKSAATAQNSEELLKRIVHGDSTFLRRATDETLAYLQWLVRFAEAEGLTDSEDQG